MTEIQGKSILVRVSEGSSYRESTVVRKSNDRTLFEFDYVLLPNSIGINPWIENG